MTGQQSHHQVAGRGGRLHPPHNRSCACIDCEDDGDSRPPSQPLQARERVSSSIQRQRRHDPPAKERLTPAWEELSRKFGWRQPSRHRIPPVLLSKSRQATAIYGRTKQVKALRGIPTSATRHRGHDGASHGKRHPPHVYTQRKIPLTEDTITAAFFDRIVGNGKQVPANPLARAR